MLGVRQPGNVTGVNPIEVEQVYEAALRRLDPIPNTSLRFVRVGDGVTAVVEVERSTHLVLSAGGALVRVGASVRPMTRDQILHALPREDAAELAEGVVGLTKEVASLREQVELANTFRQQLPNYIWGGLIGTIIGVIATRVLGS